MTTHGKTFEATLQQWLWGKEAVLWPLLQQLLVMGQDVASHPGELPMSVPMGCPTASPGCSPTWAAVLMGCW